MLDFHFCTEIQIWLIMKVSKFELEGKVGTVKLMVTFYLQKSDCIKQKRFQRPFIAENQVCRLIFNKSYVFIDIQGEKNELEICCILT